MTDQSHLRQSSPLTAISKVANRPHCTEDIYIAGRRAGLILLLTSAVAINAWALFPSPDQSGHYVQLPETAKPSAANDNSAREGVDGNTIELSRASAFRLMEAKVVSSKPTMHGLATVRYPSPVVNVSLVPLRSKLQALLMLLYSQSGDLDPAALEAKLQALLKLPDSVLAQLIEHPDLADLNNMLDAVFLGTSDLSGVKTELDKIDVTSVPGPSEKIDVVKVNGKPAYVVRSPAVQNGPENAAASPVSAPPPPGEPVTVTVISAVEAPAGLTVSAFTVAPRSEPLSPPPAPAALSAPAFTVAPSSEPLSPPPAPAALTAPAFTVAPSSQQLTPSPAPAPAPMPTSTPTPEITKSPEAPNGTPQTSLDDLNSGNKFVPGDTVTDRSADNSPATNSPATQTATPSTPATDGASPADAGGVTGGGGVTSPSNNDNASPSDNDSTSPSDNDSGGTSSGGGTSP
jgi:hypothetical protein